MNKAYNRINWKDYPSKETAVNAVNLNKVDAGLNEIDNRIVLMDAGKADTETVLGLVKDVSMDSPTGIFTITYQNGTSKTFDTKLEKIAVNFEFDKATQKIVITLDSGEKQYIDLSSFVKPITFTDSADIAFSEVDNNVTATIINGSVSVEKLAPEVITTLTSETDVYSQQAVSAKNDAESARDTTIGYKNSAETSANNASASETNAANSATDAEAWAVGKRNGEDVPETDEAYHNNAKWWKEQIQDSGKIKTFFNISISKGSFIADSTYEEYPYKASVGISDIDDLGYVPDVTLSVADALSGNYAPIAECYLGGISIWAKELPESNEVVIPTIVCVKR